MKMFAAVFCAAVLFTAVGCGDKEETPKYDEKMLVGVWDGVCRENEVTGAPRPDLNWIRTDTLTSGLLVVTINADHTGKTFAFGETDPMTWSLNGETLTFSMPGESIEQHIDKIENGEMTLTSYDVYEDEYGGVNDDSIAFTAKERYSITLRKR